MSVSLVLLVAMAVMYSCGVFLMLERSMTRVLLGFLLLGNATNLLLFLTVGEIGVAPIAEDGVAAEEMTDPLPQALILTAIVITFAISAFLLALIYRSWRLAREDDLEIDEEDIAVAQGAVSLAAEHSSEPGADTEFADRAEHDRSLPRDLEEADEAATSDAADSSGAADSSDDARGAEGSARP